MIYVIGSGVVGLTVADHLINEGCEVKIITASKGTDETLCSWWAGGMLAPFCEMETAEPIIGELAKYSMGYWSKLCHGDSRCQFVANGTLVIAPNRDQSMLAHFASKTFSHEMIDATRLHALEPMLATHKQALFYKDEAHIEPRKALEALWSKLKVKCEIVTSTHLADNEVIDLQTHSHIDWVIDCRGFGSRGLQPNLRGVRGEMLHLYCPELTLSRPVRLLHPRIPIYIVPRDKQKFMLGATMIESESHLRASVRSVLELLSAAYALNPVIAQAEIVEIGVDVRPAYPDNLPKVIQCNRLISVNGMYRHGYLIAPSVSNIVKDFILYQKTNSLIHHEN